MCEERRIEAILKFVKGGKVLLFGRTGDSFDLSWRSDLSWIPSVRETVADFDNCNIPGAPWQQMDHTTHNCEKVKMISISENAQDISLTLTLRGTGKPSKPFVLPVKQIPALSKFIERIILCGVALPIIVDHETFQLKFRKIPLIRWMSLLPQNIHLERREYTSIWDITASVQQLIGRISLFIVENDVSEWPASFFSASVCSGILKSTIKSAQAAYESSRHPLTMSEFKSMFDADGRVQNPDDLRRRCLRHSIETNVIPEILPFLVGVFPMDSTESDRQQIQTAIEERAQRLITEYQLVKQGEKTYPHLKKDFDCIGKDVPRTPLYKCRRRERTPAYELVECLLYMFSIEQYDQGLRYLQGLNMWAGCVISWYFPKWSNDQEPITENGDVIDYAPYVPIIYAVLVKLVYVLEFHRNLREKGLSTCPPIDVVLKRAIPYYFAWLKIRGWLAYASQVLFACVADLFDKPVSDDMDKSRFRVALLCVGNQSMATAYGIVALLIECFEEVFANSKLDDKLSTIGSAMSGSRNPENMMKLLVWLDSAFEGSC